MIKWNSERFVNASLKPYLRYNVCVIELPPMAHRRKNPLNSSNGHLT